MSDLLERTRAAVEVLDATTVRDALSLLLSGATNQITTTTMAGRGRWDELDSITDFVTLVSFLKRNFAIPELRKFSIEDGRVLVDTGNRKVEISDSVSSRSASPPQLLPKPSDGSRPRLSPEAGDSQPGNQGTPRSPERFMNLEFDK